MMTFSEWIATQPAESWGDLDQATRDAITNWFYFREVCDDDRMVNYFWRNVAMYTPRYKAMVRVESMDFDPMVNRYFEAQYVESGESTNTSQTSGENTLAETNTASATHGDLFKEYPKTIMRVSTEVTTHNEGTDTLGPTQKTETFNNVKDTATHTGTTSDTGNSTASENSSTNTTSNASATNSGGSKASNKSANKTAPMSASGDITTATMADGTNMITGLNFSHATSFAESDSTNSTTGTSSNNATTTGGTSASKTGNSSNVHNINTGDTNIKTGSVTTGTVQAVNGNESDGTSQTFQSTSYQDGSVIERHDNSTDQNTGAHNSTGSSSSSTSGAVTRSNTSTNRYTGREGLTPQEAMMSASDYLMNYSVAFKWFVNKLDSCFIMLYDV